jgi:hypothetical protein
MSADKVKQLEQYFNKATAEATVHPDTQLLVEICNVINSRADMPKHAVGILRKRMMSTRNPKVIYLCLEFLEVAANGCELNFQTQVASKDFMSVLNALINRDIDKTVLDKLTHLTKYWVQIFGSYKDILPGIFAFAEALEKKGVKLPSHVDSSYAYLLKTKKVSQPSRDDYPTEPEPSHKSAGSFGTPAPSKGTSSSSKGLNTKLKKDLDVVKQNIQLTNEMIDAHDPREDAKNNDILTELVQTLKGMENKLRDFIAKQSDEEVLNYVLELNDDLNKTFERYKAIRQGQKPKPFIPSGVEYTIEREDKKAAPKPQSKPSAQVDLLDLLDDTTFNQGQTQQQANTNAMNKAEVQNLFDFDSTPSNQPVTTNANAFNTAQPSFGNTATTQSPQLNTQSLSSTISSLYKTAQTQPMGGFDNNFGTAPPTQNQGGFTGGFGGNMNANPNLGMGGGFGGNMGGGFGGQQQPQNQFGGQNQFGTQSQNQFGGQPQGGFGNMGYNNFNTAQANTGFGGGNQNQNQFGGQSPFGGGAFNTAQPSGGFGGYNQNQNQNAGGFGGHNQGGFGGQSQGGFGGQSQGGFGQQQMGNFNTMPTQNKPNNAFDMSGMAQSLPQTQAQPQSQPQGGQLFDDLL